MNFTEVQKKAVVEWVSQGRSLSEIQRRLKETHNLILTYMELRFLVDDLEIPLHETKAEEAPSESTEAEVVLDPEPVAEEGGVTIDVDAIVLPGALVSGGVTFSDGVSLKWQLAASGQLGLIPGDDTEYRPSPDDVQSFQAKLEEVLRSKGY